MGSTKLHAVRSGMFENATLLQNLSLHDNQLTVIPDGTFDDMQYLTTLRLDGNLLTSVSKGTFSPDSRSRLTSLNLSHNPFECTCALMWFRDWLVSDPELFDYHNPYSQYICSNLPGTDITSFHMSEQQCLLSHETYVFSVVCVAVLIITVTASSLLYRYRWHIRLVLYEAHRGDPKARWRRRRPEEFQYDLFVSYSGEDVRWVIDHLIPVLEQQVGLRLCVHQRDFIVGNNITDNIVDSLAVSKRVLALFSPRFAKSHWCHFELEVCLRHVIENNDAMVIVILEDVSPRDVSGAMSALLKTTTYIRWEEEPEARTSFWRRLQLALNDILPG
nr:hypothetical protein BaRGS_021848 [Batillaria attramentaria]